MKRICLLVFCLVFCLVLIGCGAEPDTQPVPGPEAGNVETASGKKEKAPAYDDSLLTELTLEGEYSEAGWGDPLRYSYRLPQLLADTPDALEFNAAMEQICLDAEAGNITYDSIHWNRYWNGSLLSITVDMQVTYQSNVDHFTYNYDFALGRSISQKELFDRQGYTQRQVRQALLTAAARSFDDAAVEVVRHYQGAWDALMPLRAQTISRDNLELTHNPCFLDEEGRLCCYTLIGTPAGAGAYGRLLCLEPETGTGLRKTVKCEFITARLENNNVTLTFDNTELAGLFVPQLPQLTVQYGMAYPVEGLYGEYTDLTVSFVGNDGTAFLLLRDTNGCVTFCNIMEGLNNGGRFLAVGPIPEPAGITGFRGEGDEGGSTVLGILENGETVDLGYVVYPYVAYIPEDLLADRWQAGDYALDPGGEQFPVTWTQDGAVLATAYAFAYLGMDEDGMHFRFLMTDENGEISAFLAVLSARMNVFTYYEPDTLTIQHIFGAGVLGIPQGGSVELLR